MDKKQPVDWPRKKIEKSTIPDCCLTCRFANWYYEYYFCEAWLLKDNPNISNYDDYKGFEWPYEVDDYELCSCFERNEEYK